LEDHLLHTGKGVKNISLIINGTKVEFQSYLFGILAEPSFDMLKGSDGFLSFPEL